MNNIVPESYPNCNPSVHREDTGVQPQDATYGVDENSNISNLQKTEISSVLEKDYQEFKASHISDDTIALNFISFEDEYEPIEHLTYALQRSDYLNSGRLKSRYYRHLKHLKYGSWGCFGVDVLTGETSRWGKIKPKVPRTATKIAKGGEKKIKPIKYEQPRKTLSELFAPKLTQAQWKGVAARYDVAMPDRIAVEDDWAKGFYAWVQENPTIPIVIPEGEKKACCLTEDGYVLLGVPGITMGYRQPKDEYGNKIGDPYLIPQLAHFAQSGREFCFAFDNDSKESTRINVEKAIITTGDLLIEAGCQVSVISWSDESEKGLDDLVVAHGVERFAQAFNDRLALTEYKYKIYAALGNKAYKEKKKFTPGKTVSQRYLDVDLSQSNTAYFLKSGLGSGKTEMTIRQLEKETERPIFFISYRNSLCLQTNERAKSLGIYHYQSDKNLEEFNVLDPKLRISLCIDSLLHIASAPINNAIVVLDEVVSILKHFLFSSTIRQFAKIKTLFAEIINRCDRIICLDGNMQNWCVDIISALCPNKKIVTVENTYKATKSRVVILDGVIKNEKLQRNNKTPLVKQALSERCPAITTDSQIFGETTERLFKAQGSVGLRVDSKTTSDERVKAFLANPDKWLESNRIDYLICSPSVESGVDLNIREYFSNKYHFGFGTLDIDSILQHTARVRDWSITQYIWAKEYVYSSDNETRSANIDKIRSARHTKFLEEAKELIDCKQFTSLEKLQRVEKLIRSEGDIFADTADTIQAFRNHEQKNYRSCLADAYREAGHEVTFYRPDYEDDDFKTISRRFSEEKEAVRRSDAVKIHESSDKYLEKPKTTIAFDAPLAEKNALKKAKLVARIPGITKSSVWSPEFIFEVLHKQPRLINQIEQNYLLNNSEIANKLAADKYKRLHNNPGDRIWQLATTLPRLRAFKDVGLFDLVQKRIEAPDLEIDINSDEVRQIIKACKKLPTHKSIGSFGNYEMRSLKQILISFGYGTTSRKIKRDGKTVRLYFLNPDYLSTPINQAIAQGVRLKYEQLFNTSPETLTWDEQAYSDGIKQACLNTVKKMPESTATHTKTEVAHLDVNDNNNRQMCHPIEQADLSGNTSVEKVISTELQDPLDSEEAIQDLVLIVMSLENGEQVAELSRQGRAFSRSRLNRAVRRLSKEWQSKIRGWVFGNHEQQTT